MSKLKLIFEVLFDDTFMSFNDDKSISPEINKLFISTINDFEDGAWRYKKFQNFIWDNIAETALSAAERASLADQSHSSLAAAAKSLRLTDAAANDNGRGSELAEIVLYAIMKHHYGALPVVPKIFYKQNSQDNAKGADSVHITITTSGFCIWFGEAKFYNDIKDARLNQIVESVADTLRTDKLKKENSIITNVRDLDTFPIDGVLRDQIKNLLKNQETIDKLKPHLHIPILLLHECTITQGATALTDEYKKEIIAFHKDRAKSYFKKQVEGLSEKIALYPEIHFHLILFPIPNKKQIVDTFLSNVAFYKTQ
jgi:hypothetical protein